MMYKTYLRKIDNFEVTDVSGKKTLAQIKKEFGSGIYQVVSFNEKTHFHTYDGNGDLIIKSKAQHKKELKQAEQLKQAKIANDVKPVFQDLGLTESKAKKLMRAMRYLDESNFPT